MSTVFESSLSSSLSGRPTMSAMAPSMADQLPSINFGFDDLRDRMAKFTAKFDAFIEQGRKRVLEEHNQFRMNLAELQAHEEKGYGNRTTQDQHTPADTVERRRRATRDGERDRFSHGTTGRELRSTG
ncbi:hypothetical protein NUW58_g8965 [Xylaria curta]|uniref:Uncharacterized protein n=1 Tax=Xylaria curta TaxID=42375 RepID=A0ACC1N322_9PEZI|nr:hypothetical protein NUW58_g8965 [Xylaria curta]